MRLVTLGELMLEGSKFRRLKPLSVAVYLLIEGPTLRRDLADFFWVGANDPMNSLAVAIGHLRRLGLADGDERLAWANPGVLCDAVEIDHAIKMGRWQEAVRLYNGDFLSGNALQEVSSDLEDWAERIRQTFASQLRRLMLNHANRLAEQGNFIDAAEVAARAFQLSKQTIEPDILPALHMVLMAGNHQAAFDVQKEALELGLKFQLNSDLARQRLRKHFVGRKRELEQLRALEPGQWAWIQAAPSLGKTTLLEQLLERGRLVSAKSGTPYATLEPLLKDFDDSDQELIANRLARAQGMFLVDDWESIDPESQALLIQVQRLRPRGCWVIASNVQPVFRAEISIQLGLLNSNELQNHAGLYELTAGIPALIGAHFRQEPLETELAKLLSRLPDSTSTLFAVLTLLERTDLVVVREASQLDSQGLATALNTLIQIGFVEPSGVVRIPKLAKHWLETNPSLAASIAQRIAPLLEPLEAYPFYQRAGALMGEQHHDAAKLAALTWANESLRRGAPSEALAALQSQTDDPQVRLLRARALERSGRYRESLINLETGDTLFQSLKDVLALKSALLWRLGQAQEARATASNALEGNNETRAEALQVLGNLAFDQGDFQTALEYFSRSAALFRTFGDQIRFAEVLNDAATAKCELGTEAEPAFKEALDAASEHPILHARVLTNLGNVYERRNDFLKAQSAYEQSLEKAESSGARDSEARAWNNLGVLHHKTGEHTRAQTAYNKAIEIARAGQEALLLASALANLSELNNDFGALEEAIRILEKSGNYDIAKRYRQRITAMKSSSGVQAEA
jgi:tetratricopeptide (TPR) repeat protein